jgi:hypothetical protein
MQVGRGSPHPHFPKKNFPIIAEKSLQLYPDKIIYISTYSCMSTVYGSILEQTHTKKSNKPKICKESNNFTHCSSRTLLLQIKSK